jgi:ectoine hydroxylase-related dioxygenase (phytanoyl-CoA dioxygenase family)
MDIAAVKEKLGRDGYCIVPGVLSADEADSVRDRLWAAAEESRRRGVDTFMPVLDPNESNVRVFNLLDIDQTFRDLIRHPLAMELVTSLLGPSILISNFTANIARPGAKSMKIHSDQSIVVPEPWAHPWSMNIIWALDDVYAENGATLFLPGSHRYVNRKDVPADARERMIPFEAPKGSIIAMEGRMWHTSGANTTKDKDRALLFGYYSCNFLRPQVNWNAGLSPETIAGLDEEMVCLLGLGPDANTELAEPIIQDVMKGAPVDMLSKAHAAA